MQACRLDSTSSLDLPTHSAAERTVGGRGCLAERVERVSNVRHEQREHSRQADTSGGSASVRATRARPPAAAVMHLARPARPDRAPSERELAASRTMSVDPAVADTLHDV